MPLDTASEARVLLVPRHEGTYAKVGTVAEVVETGRLPGGEQVATLSGKTRAQLRAAETSTGGRLYVEVEEQPDETPPPIKTRELETEYRAVVEEILELREADARIGEFLRSITEPGALADTCAYSPDLTFAQRVELLETLDVIERLRLAVTAAARAAGRAAGPPAHPRGRRDRRAGPAAGVLPAQAARVDPQGARRGRGLGGRRVPDEDRGIGHARRGARAGGARARPARAHGRFLGRGVDDPHLPRLAPGRALEQDVGRAARPEGRPRGPRRRPRRPAGREGADRRVPGRAQAAPGAGNRGGQALRRDPHPDRPSRDRQDLDRRVDRPCAQPRVRADVARRRPRRGRDPRPPAHLHRRPARPARPRPARRRDDEPGDHARRGRQGRRRLARRPVRGAARGARPGTEPLVPRPLPRRRARPVAGRLHRDRQRRRDDPRAAPRPHGGDPLRRLHGRREGRDRQGLPLAAAARAQRPPRGRGRDRRRRASRRSSPSTPAKPESGSSSASSASSSARPPLASPPATRSRRSRSTSRSCATPSAGSASGRSRPNVRPCPASRPVWP